MSSISVIAPWGRVTITNGEVVDTDTPEARTEALRRLRLPSVVVWIAGEFVREVTPDDDDWAEHALTYDAGVVVRHSADVPTPPRGPEGTS